MILALRLNQPVLDHSLCFLETLWKRLPETPRRNVLQRGFLKNPDTPLNLEVLETEQKVCLLETLPMMHFLFQLWFQTFPKKLNLKEPTFSKHLVGPSVFLAPPRFADCPSSSMPHLLRFDSFSRWQAWTCGCFASAKFQGVLFFDPFCSNIKKKNPRPFGRFCSNASVGWWSLNLM